ncbi:MAG: hypothetical protein JWM11_2828 [Planctomycetaceae bacterium]|nr:hypothetical protein [Planctomycetaceae bacterium]
MPFKDVTTVIQDTALWWAAHWRSPESRIDRIAHTAPGGMERFERLLVTVGLEIKDSGALGQWDKFEGRLALLADEMRFRIFEDREDAVQAALNSIEVALHKAGYECLTDWERFSNEFMAHLRSPHSNPSVLKKCIRKHFRRPVVIPD